MMACTQGRLVMVIRSLFAIGCVCLLSIEQATGADAAPTQPGDSPPAQACPVVGMDSDGDGLTNCVEVTYIGTDPYNIDTDGDALLYPAWDMTATDGWELDYGTSPLVADPDTDGDGWIDVVEVYWGDYNTAAHPEHEPCVISTTDADTDDDGVTDPYDVFGYAADSQFDGLCSWMDSDSDNDGLLDGQELRWGTGAWVPDSDSDGYSDGQEVRSGSDPTNPRSTPRRP